MVLPRTSNQVFKGPEVSLGIIKTAIWMRQPLEVINCTGEMACCSSLTWMWAVSAILSIQSAVLVTSHSNQSLPIPTLTLTLTDLNPIPTATPTLTSTLNLTLTLTLTLTLILTLSLTLSRAQGFAAHAVSGHVLGQTAQPAAALQRARGGHRRLSETHVLHRSGLRLRQRADRLVLGPAAGHPLPTRGFAAVDHHPDSV
jgi:hypothetical protein